MLSAIVDPFLERPESGALRDFLEDLYKICYLYLEYK